MSLTGQPKEDTAKIDVPDYLGFALTQLPYEDIPEEPRSSWHLTEAVEEGSGKTHWFVTQTCFVKNGIHTYWYDLEALAKLIHLAQAAGIRLQEKLASSGGLTVATPDQMVQAVSNMEKSKRDLLGKPGN